MTLTSAFLDQAETCTRMGSPLMGRVLRILSKGWNPDSELGRAMDMYSGDIGPAGHSLPLRIAGGLHALVLLKKDAKLIAAYPPNVVDDQTLQSAVLEALQSHEAFCLDWTTSPPQTNEVRRSAALIAMAHIAQDHFDRPIVLSELGASGGLNLVWDQFDLDIDGTSLGPSDAVLTLRPDWDGPLPPPARPVIAMRGGVDLNPLDPSNADDLLRLTAYLWADQPERLENTRLAARALDVSVDRGDAIDWLDRRLRQVPQGHMHVIQHTVAWQYFPADAQQRGQDLIESAGAKATADSPLAWMQMETDGDKTGAVGAALTCLLYTSPSPRDKRQSRMPSSA